MKYEEKGTLAYYEAIPQLKQINLSDIPVANTTKSYKLYKEGAGEVLPDAQAVNFYALNHLASLVKTKFTKHEKLPEWAVKIMDTYTAQLVAQGQRMFYYMLIICTRETRHATQKFEKNLDTVTSSAYQTWWNKIKAKGSTQTMDFFLQNPPIFSLGDYTKYMMLCFDNMSFASGYGGTKWGEIARVLHHFCVGQISMEMLVDTGYTLAHNGGPIFNKGFLYVHYTHEINKILDIQRSGQIPEYVLVKNDTVSGDNVVSQELYDLVKGYKDLFPEEFGDYVDYYKVEALGSLHKYSAEKTAQKKKHGAKATAEVEVLDWFHVDPWNKVPVMKSPRAPKKTTTKQGVYK